MTARVQFVIGNFALHPNRAELRFESAANATRQLRNGQDFRCLLKQILRPLHRLQLTTKDTKTTKVKKSRTENYLRELAKPSENFAPVDLIVDTRGGGSMEDLWEFNEEIVARTIVDVTVPIVSAIGHEIDFTICDFVADLRAPTPSAAAELIVPDIVDLRRHMDACARGIGRELVNRLRDSQQRMDHARETLRRCLAHKIDNYRRGLSHALATLQARSPVRELMLRRNRFGDLQRRFTELPARALENARHRFQRIDGILRVLGPEATLRRGYSITKNERGEVIRTVTAVRPKMKIRTRVADGEFGSEVL